MPSFSVGLSQYFFWDLHSSAPAPASLIGPVTSGGPKVTYASQRIIGVGNKENIRPELTLPKFDVKAAATNDCKPLLINSVRPSGGNLPVLKANIGSAQLNHFVDNAKVNSATWSFNDVKSPMEVEFDIWGLNTTTSYTGLSPTSTFNSDVITGYNSNITIGGADLGVFKASGKVDNALKMGGTLGARSAGAVRLPTYLVEGVESHELNIECATPISTFDPAADAPSEALAVVVSVTVPSPVNTTPTSITLTYSNLSFDAGSCEQQMTPNGIVTFKYKLLGGPGALVIS